MRAVALLALLLASAAAPISGVRAPGGVHPTCGVHPTWHPAVLHPRSEPSPSDPSPSGSTAVIDGKDDAPASMPRRYPPAGYSPHKGTSAGLRTRELPCPFAKGHAQLITQNLLEIFLFFERSKLFARFFLLLFRKFAIRSDCSAVPASLLDSFLVDLSVC